MTQRRERLKRQLLDSSNNFNEEDRYQLKEINETVKKLFDELQDLRKELSGTKKELMETKIENARLKQMVNINTYALDALEQYSRRENIRIHGVAEGNNRSNKDDGEEKLYEVANALNINLEDFDLQRVHRLGKKKNSVDARPRPIIARFTSYKKRNEFLYEKSNLKNCENLGSAFITEDLTPLRSKLLRYVKNECEDQFVLCHTINGKIRMKKSAVKNGQMINSHEKDPGIGKWITINSPDDLFKIGIDINFDKLGFQPLLFNNDDYKHHESDNVSSCSIVK